MRKTLALLLFAGLFVVVALAAQFIRSSDEGKAVDQITGNPHRAFAAHAQSSRLELLEPATRQERGVFTTRTGKTLEVFEGERSRAFDDAGSVSTNDVRTCVSATGAGFAAMACRPEPLFAGSDTLWVESWAGGPATSDRSDYALAGITSPRVARIDAVTTDKAVVRARLSKDRAFLVELSDAQVRAGVAITTLNVYGHRGLLRTVSLGR